MSDVDDDFIVRQKIFIILYLPFMKYIKYTTGLNDKKFSFSYFKSIS